MPKNFLIMGTQRTGSTALYRSLNFHPEVACGGEWVLDTPYFQKLKTTERLLEGEFSSLRPSELETIDQKFGPEIRWLGFKVLFRSSDKWLLHPAVSPALALDRLTDFIRWVSNQSNIHVIHICRDDYIDWLKSKYLASATGRFVVRPYPDDVKINVPVKGAIRRLRSKEWIDLRISSLADTNPYLRVSYEDFLESRWATIQKLMSFLDCEVEQIESMDYKKLQKQSNKAPSDYISNFAELTEAVSARFQNMELESGS